MSNADGDPQARPKSPDEMNTDELQQYIAEYMKTVEQQFAHLKDETVRRFRQRLEHSDRTFAAMTAKQQRRIVLQTKLNIMLEVMNSTDFNDTVTVKAPGWDDGQLG